VSGEPRSIEVRIAERTPADTRADSYLADTLRLFSRSQARKRVVRLLLNGRPAKLSRRVAPGDLLFVEYKDAPAVELLPEAIPLSVLYEDEDVIVVDKPSGLVVHPAAGNPSGTLVNALLYHCSRLGGEFPAAETRPGIVHRLDKGTSGVIITAKNQSSREFLARQFRLRRVGKLYAAIVQGEPPAEAGRIESRLARDRRNRKRFRSLPEGAHGKRAITLYRILRRKAGHCLLALRPRTGRTHQLRVQLASVGCPIVGDSLYGSRVKAEMMLHACRLRLRLPGSAVAVSFRSPLPPRFAVYWRELGGSSDR
jgi:23S rRNA pseudouridine1911/1915/1917 synthase